MNALIPQLSRSHAPRGNAVLAAPAARPRTRRRSVGTCSHAGAWERKRGLAMSELPANWTLTPLHILGQWGCGGTPKRTTAAYFEGGTIPWLVIGDLNDGLVIDAAARITEIGLKNSSAKLLPLNTLLVAMYGSIGKLGITGIECATNQAIAFCIPDAHIVWLRYLFYALRSEKELLITQGQGGAQQNISQGILKQYETPLAPRNEQKRIADKLDAVLARVDACRERLDRVPTILKRFRQSVLAAATSGPCSPRPSAVNWSPRTRTMSRPVSYWRESGIAPRTASRDAAPVAPSRYRRQGMNRPAAKPQPPRPHHGHRQSAGHLNRVPHEMRNLHGVFGLGDFTNHGGDAV